MHPIILKQINKYKDESLYFMINEYNQVFFVLKDTTDNIYGFIFTALLIKDPVSDTIYGFIPFELSKNEIHERINSEKILLTKMFTTIKPYIKRIVKNTIKFLENYNL